MIHYITIDGVGNATVANELHELERDGIPFKLHAMRRPGSRFHHAEWAHRLDAATQVLYPLPALELIGSILAAPFLFRGRFFAALANALFGRREHRRARIASIAHLAVACHWARRLRDQEVSHIHAPWIHSCGTIGMYGAWLLGVSFSFMGHATDLFRDRAALLDKIRRADFIICISTFHRDFYLEQGARPRQLHLAYCGIDTERFRGGVPVRRAADPMHVISAGRLVEKKGFVYLIDACDRLARRGVDIRCTIAGSGPLEDELRARIAARDLVDRVTLTGTALTQEDLPGFMAIGDAFCLPCVRASDNDVDGLPQVLMEAMACGLPAVSTRLVGIPDLVIHEETGLLVPPGAAERVADALHRLKEDPELAARLAEAGQRHAREHFDIRTSLQPMLMLFRRRLAAADQRPEPAEPAAPATETEDGGSVALPGRGAPAHRTTTARLGAARRRSPR